MGALDSVRESATSEIQVADGVDVGVDVSKSKPCNQRKPLSHASEAFPHIDFANCQEADPLPQVETIEQVDERVGEFEAWLREWIDREVAEHGGDLHVEVVLVSHYVFLHRLVSKINGRIGDSSEKCGFKNCEVRKLPLSSIL